jgi:hypothetical protein
MADFLHTREYIRSDQAACVTLDRAANVMLLTDSNFAKYKHGQQYSYYGGHYRRSPVFIRPPRTDNYNVVIDLGGGSGSIRYSISIVDA